MHVEHMVAASPHLQVVNIGEWDLVPIGLWALVMPGVIRGAPGESFLLAGLYSSLVGGKGNGHIVVIGQPRSLLGITSNHVICPQGEEAEQMSQPSPVG